MDLKDVLKSRRSIRQFTDQPLHENLLRNILSYAPWVPNHHVSEPWRFVVVTGHSLQELAQLRFEAVREKRRGQPEADARAEKARQEFLQAQAVIAVAQQLDPDPVRREEDYASVAMACYNIILAAWDQGVGCFWNTGPIVTSDTVRTWLSLADDEKPVAFLRMGYPAATPIQRRSPVDERITWRR